MTNLKCKICGATAVWIARAIDEDNEELDQWKETSAPLCEEHCQEIQNMYLGFEQSMKDYIGFSIQCFTGIDKPMIPIVAMDAKDIRS